MKSIFIPTFMAAVLAVSVTVEANKIEYEIINNEIVKNDCLFFNLLTVSMKMCTEFLLMDWI